MTFEKLQQIIEENNIPHDVQLQSDSGRECCETEMDGVYYDAEENRLIFTRHGTVYDRCFQKEFCILNGRNKKCKKCKHLSYTECDLGRSILGDDINDREVEINNTSDCKDFENKDRY